MANGEKQVTTPKDKSLEDLAVRYQTEIYMMGDKSKSKTKRETDLEKKLQSVLNKLSGTNVMGGKGRQRILSVIKQRAMSNYRDEMYAAGGSVTDNAGLRALKKASPQAYANIKKGS